MMTRKMLVASGNKGKIKEIRAYFGKMDNQSKFEQNNNGQESTVIKNNQQGKNVIENDQQAEIFEIVGLDQFPELAEVEEDGDTFTANALKKARVRAKSTGLLTLADDSGLVVDCLDGAPGVYSARYAGEKATDEENNSKLREALAGVPAEERTAYFQCVMVLVDPDSGEEIVVEGSCPGIIELEARGDNGFGYDPLFYLPEYQKTMAELPLTVKNKISHRAKALKKMKKEINKRYS